MKRMKKNDIIFMVVLCIAVLVMFFYRNNNRENGAYVQVTINGEPYGTYPLMEEQEIPIITDKKTTNTLVIKNGLADMTEADCPDGLCIHQNAISKTNETIVCLPNKVVVQVLGTEESGIDTIAK